MRKARWILIKYVMILVLLTTIVTFLLTLDHESNPGRRVTNFYVLPMSTVEFGLLILCASLGSILLASKLTSEIARRKNPGAPGAVHFVLVWSIPMLLITQAWNLSTDGLFLSRILVALPIAVFIGWLAGKAVNKKVINT
ncbi:MAG: hypothetical protein HEP71_02485 [Roseivirga sp.]|nr:hypothetical protein [Roseivirga sp.]